MTRLERVLAELAYSRRHRYALVRVADLAALLAVADAARHLGPACVAQPPCDCPECRLAAALAALDGAADD